MTEAIIPTNPRRPDLWAEAFRVAGQPPPRSPSILIHRDYHAWNTLWVADRLTGVVDWSSASIGPPAADLAHLLVDLAIDASVDAALGARSAYAAAGGDLSDGRFHQLRTIFDRLTDSDPTDLARPEVDRLERFLEIVLAERDPASG